jgi:hypothetical protein
VDRREGNAHWAATTGGGGINPLHHVAIFLPVPREIFFLNIFETNYYNLAESSTVGHTEPDAPKVGYFFLQLTKL